jgi:hypothetical protein
MWNQIMKLSYAGAFNPPLFIYRGPPHEQVWGPAG